MDFEKTVSLRHTITSDSAPQGLADDRLEKSFSIWSLASLCLCLMATWEALSSTVAQALLSGGAPCLFYNYIISFFGSVAIVCSLAEIASMYPTAGGQYHWVAVMAPPDRKLAASWFTAWISIGGQVVLTASAAFAAGLQFQALIALNDPTYLRQTWQGMLFYDLVLVYALLINIYGTRMLAFSNSAAGVLHIVGLLAIIIVLGVLAPKQNADFVFTTITNNTGWSNNGTAWLIGLLSSTYSFLGYDAATHLSEELPNPRRNVPLAMVGSVCVNGILGLVYCVMLLFSLQDIDAVIGTRLGFPFMQVYLDVVKSPAGATVMSLVLSLIGVAANAAGLTSTSRTFWSLARDDATPFARYFAHIDHKWKTPVRVLVLISVLQILLGFIYLGNSTAYNAILSMSILGMYLSYLLPIIYMMLYGRKSVMHVPGPFTLGRIGVPVNIVAIGWLILAMFWSTWPNFYPVTPVNMNYSTVVMAGWISIGAVWYLLLGRKRYSGPVIELNGEPPHLAKSKN